MKVRLPENNYFISIHAPAKGATMVHGRPDGTARFQSTLPRRERLSFTQFTYISIYFNPRSREGSDGIPDGLCPAWMLFQSTLPRRERRYCPSDDHCRTDFNPRSREGSDPVRCLRFSMLHYFNPRSREGSDCGCFSVSQFCVISIHAPAKGATAFINIFSLTVRLFLFHLTNKI